MAGFKCDVCGQNEMAEVEDQPGMYKCVYCGTQYTQSQLEERSVKLDGPVKIDGAVQVQGVQNLEKLLQNGETFLKLKKYDKASKLYSSLTDDYPERYESWYGLVKCSTFMGNDVSDELKTAKELANTYEQNHMLNELDSIGNDLRMKHNSDLAKKFFGLLINSYPESYKGWYGYVLSESENLHKKVDDNNFNSKFDKAVEKAEKENVGDVINNLNLYKEIRKNLTSIEEKQKHIEDINAKEDKDVSTLINKKNTKIGELNSSVRNFENSKKNEGNSFKNKELSSYCQTLNEKNKLEEELVNKKAKNKTAWKKFVPALIIFILVSIPEAIGAGICIATVAYAFSGILQFLVTLFILGPIGIGIGGFICSIFFGKFLDAFEELWTVPEVLFGWLKINKLNRKIAHLNKKSEKLRSVADTNIKAHEDEMNSTIQARSKEASDDIEKIKAENEEELNKIKDEASKKIKKYKEEISELEEKNKELEAQLNIPSTVTA